MHTGGPLSIAVISPDRKRRIAATSAFAQGGHVETREFVEYPQSLEDAPRALGRTFDVVLVELDTNPAFALDLVEALCISQSTIVMVFSERAEPELILRCMRAGAREFFTLPFTPSQVAKALLWVSSHRRQALPARKASGRMLIFFGSKGGVGVTMLASNVAVALADKSNKRILLIDLNLQLGDAAINLGVTSTHSVLDALQASTQLDAEMLLQFVVRHSSGLDVLPAPAEFHATQATNVAIGCLLAVARQRFDFIVIDAGKKIDLRQMHLFEESATAYLVTQVGIPELRNANRLITQFSTESSPKLEVVINRYQSRFLGLTDQHIAKALSRPVNWKIPNDFAAVQEMQRTGTPIVHRDSPIARVILHLALSACGLSEPGTDNSRVSARKPGLRLMNGAARIEALESIPGSFRNPHSFRS
jgi:pilus assembly protein CpaE